MTDKQTPPDWVLIEAAKRCKWDGYYPLNTLKISYGNNAVFVALCDMILKYEQPPIDRKLLCAREAVSHAGGKQFSEWQKGLMKTAAIRAIELWEEGFGK